MLQSFSQKSSEGASADAQAAAAGGWPAGAVGDPCTPVPVAATCSPIGVVGASADAHAAAAGGWLAGELEASASIVIEPPAPDLPAMVHSTPIRVPASASLSVDVETCIATAPPAAAEISAWSPTLEAIVTNPANHYLLPAAPTAVPATSRSGYTMA